MASYKSHIIPPRRTEDQTPYSHRAPTTRLPQRSVTPTSTVTVTSQVSSQVHSKLQKRRFTRDEQVQQSRGINNQRAPVSKSSLAAKARQGGTHTVPTPPLPSGMAAPKTFRQISSSRLPKLEVVSTTSTPSLVSGSSTSTSTIDSPRSNVLRRKPSSIGITTGRPGYRPRADSMSSQDEGQPTKDTSGGFRDPFSETVLGITLPPSSSILARSGGEVEVSSTGYYDYEVGPTEILTLPAPQYALSSTPSTRYSESPGPFSVSSTPTSMSSYSPGVTLSTKSATRVRQASPLQSRPPVVRHRTPDESTFRQQHGLPAVRESSTSSSSTSTVLADGNKQKAQQSPHHLPPPPPSLQIGTVPRAQAPPELAHLADHQPASSQLPRRPARPSRNNTAEIVGLREPSPVIQSNMTSFPSSHRRTSSTESKMSITVSGRTRFGIPSKPTSRNPSPSLGATATFSPGSRAPTREPTPDVQQQSRALPVTSSSTAPSPSKTSRFGFFRRTKTEPTPAPKSEKKLRRGPAAGTGHEGYGRYAVRGRSGSSMSGSSIGRSASAGTTTESLNRTPSSRKSSMTSTTSTEVDDYFLERLAPVAIRGTGSSAELSRSPDPTRSGSSLDISSAPGEGPKKIQGSSRPNVEKKKPTLLPSAMSDPVRGGSPMKRMPLGPRRPSESDDDVKRSFLPSLTTRRTSRASKSIDGAPLSKVISSGSTTEQGSKAKYKKDKAEKEKAEKAEKAASKPSKKWNFFQRAHAAPKTESPAVDAAASANRVPPSRSVAHYALMDSQSGIDLEDIEQLMQEPDATPEEPLSPVGQVDRTPSGTESEQKERLQSMLLPPKPVFPSHLPSARSASPKVYLHPEAPPQAPKHKLSIDTTEQTISNPPVRLSQSDLTPVTDLSPSSPSRPLSPVELTPAVELPQSPPVFVLPQSLPSPGPPPANPPPRPSRLAQVGRIPQVISRRNQGHRPPSQSFSRPFVVDQPRPNVPPRTSLDSASPLSVSAGAVEPYPVLRGLDALSHSLAIATMSPSAEEASRQSEFFKFPPRKDSEVSYSSSSGIWSFAPTSGTAMVPVTGAPQSEDEIWKEYDDLIDEVLSPLDVGTGEHKTGTPTRHPSLEPLPLKTKVSRVSTQSGASHQSLHLRRSRLLAVLHSAQSPTSPISLSDFLQDYGDRNLSVIDPITGRLSFPSSIRMSTGSAPRNRPSSTRSSLPASLTLSARQSKATLASNSDKDRGSASTNRYRDTRLMDLAETQSDGLVSMANLRFGALMTSKWLSFGRVLFSPAHFEMKNPSQDRVLIIDGLGKDWSYYCALTYPEATIYNLGSGASSSTAANGNASEPWSTLRNHHHVGQESLAAPFPFDSGFFACVVLRFPPALPSSVHRSVISECKRVLRPGGHLELSVLDMDLVNMGNRARRAVRGLKVKMQVADEQISLRNISDEIMAGLGRKGFTECNRCFVGVPVAGKLPNPEEMKRSGSTTSSQKSKGTPKAAKKPKPEVSFSDLLSKHSSSDSTADGIADMVARVGRWWYSRCYESLVLPEAGEDGNVLENSIWRDESLIRECEKRGTSFRLLIGYAQKPEVGVRRTVSV